MTPFLVLGRRSKLTACCDWSFDTVGVCGSNPHAPTIRLQASRQCGQNLRMPGRQGLAALRRYLIQVGVEGTGLGLGIATGGGRLSRPQLGAQGVGYACVRDEPVRQLAQTVVAD